MATGNFRLKTDNDWNTIFFRFKQGKQFDLECSTGFQCPKGRWSTTKQEVLTTKEIDFKKINIKLKELDTFIRKEYESSKLADETILINNKWLKGKIDYFLNKETKDQEINESLFFTNFITSFINESRARKTQKNAPVANRTIQHYTTTLNKVIAFQQHTGKKIKLSEIDLKFHTQFVGYLENIEILNPKTIGGFISVIKLLCKSASIKGFKIPSDYKSKEFYKPTNKTYDIYLKEEEVQKIYNTKYDTEYLDNARDWLIIGIRTGLRISDLKKLDKTVIIDGYIEILTKKTEYAVVIPLHHEVEAILKKRSGEFPRAISDQKFNVYIKEVGRIAGLIEIVEGAKLVEIPNADKFSKKKLYRKKFGKYPKYELISTHTCRRSFATLLYGHIDTISIMKIIGHTTEKQLLEYLKITPKESAIKLKNYWKQIEQNKII